MMREEGVNLLLRFRYEHVNYKGKAYTTGHDIGALGVVGLNDKISSIKLGPNTHVCYLSISLAPSFSSAPLHPPLHS